MQEKELNLRLPWVSKTASFMASLSPDSHPQLSSSQTAVIRFTFFPQFYLKLIDIHHFQDIQRDSLIYICHEMITRRCSANISLFIQIR